MRLKKNFIVIVALALLVVCAGAIAGVHYFGNRGAEEIQTTKKDTVSDRTSSTKHKYTLMVKDKSGNPVKGALAAFYDSDNNMVDLPMATNSVGSAVYIVDEEGNYGVGLLSVPFRYVLDSEIRSFGKGETRVTVTLEDNPKAYVAQIGDKKYVFEDAIKYANASEEDVTITLLGDIGFSAVTIKNEFGKKITVDGNGHTITTLGGGNAIGINQKSGTIEFVNMTIDHKNSGQIFKANYAIDLNLKNVKLLATHDQEKAYIYCLINFMGEGTSNLYMEKVDVVMATTSKASSSGAGIIRTGNTDTAKHVNITMKNCNLDTTGAAGRSGIVVMENTTSNLKLSGTKIMTKNAYAIRPYGQNLTYSEDCQFGSEDAWYNAHPIEWFNAVIGNKKYTLAKALKVANESSEDVTIKMIGDLAVWNGVTIKNVNGKNITIDGGGYTLYLGGTSHALRVAQATGTVTIQNMNIDHIGSGMLMRIGQNRDTDNSTEKLAVNLNNVNIKSTGTYKYCLVGTQDYKTFNVNMTDVNVDWDKAETYSGSAFLRVGGGTDYAQTLNLTMTDCLVDVSGAGKTQGFYMVKKTEGAIDLNNTTIITAGSNIYTNSGKIKIDADAECEFSTNGGKPVAKIGSETYLSLLRALEVANISTEDVTIEILGDITTQMPMTIDNANGKNITIKGSGYKLEARTTTDHVFNADQLNGMVTIQDLDIVHSGNKMLMCIGQNRTTDQSAEELTVNLNNMDVKSTSTYQYCLVGTQDYKKFNVNMTEVNVDWDKEEDYASSAFIRIGGGTDKAQTTNLTMTDCVVDVSGATPTQGMYMVKNTEGTVDLVNTTFITAGANTYTNSGKIKVNADAECEFSTNGGTPVAKIGNETYLSLFRALAVANTSTEDVTIEILGDILTQMPMTINNVNGKNITVNGSGYKLDAKTTTDHVFNVDQLNGTVTIQDLDVAHSGNKMLMCIGQNRTTNQSSEELTVNLSNMNIKSTSTYQYCLVGTQDYKTFNVNMTDINVDWDKEEDYASSAFIRIGGGTADVQTTHLTMTDCVVDVSGAGTTQGMYIVEKVKGTIDLINTMFITSGVDTYTNKGNITISTSDGTPVAKIGDEMYFSLTRAVAAANASQEDATIELLADITDDNSGESDNEAVIINNENGKNITLNGNGKTLTTSSMNAGTRPAIRIHQTSGTVTVQNLKVSHSGKSMLLRIGDNTWDDTASDVTVNLNDVNITSTSTYQYCLIATQDPGTFDLNMTNVTVDWDKGGTQKASAFIRCGGNASYTHEVNIAMTGCTIDVSGAALTQGVYITAGADVNITRDTATTIVTAEGISRYTKEAKTLDAFLEALTFANASTDDVTIKMTSNITYNNSGDSDNAVIINNVNGKHVILDGNGKTLTTSATKHGTRPAIRIHQTSGTVTVQNLKVSHSGKSMLLRIGDNTWDDTASDVTVNLKDVTITSTSTYQYCLIATQDPGTFDLNMTNVTVDWDKEGTQKASAFIRCGGNANYIHEVKITMTGCTIDVSGAALTQGLYITAGVSGKVTQTDTTITTAEGIAQYTNKAGDSIQIQ